MIKKNEKWQEEVLIKWQELTTEEVTWEHYTDMQRQYPTSTLRTRLFSMEGAMLTKKVDTWGANEN